ncbi:uncharacterized protein F5147DRAFT_655712 [Suillus discolor]|uniref:Uncharacterized protein n=1 Tax=Suillus discolor TaxID=1912936 RepID=A0A9P7JQS8_9AGAM|nr:uncharacterized protein F5147DRAFT_655712 [Suillus discolor]KAG2099877.1 hypothetical protein F5147DRAFT_655712 [Suillus discolor]
MTEIKRSSGESVGTEKNKSVEELVDSDKSYQAGTNVGLVSGAKIVDNLKKNSDMDPEKYRKRRGSGVRRHGIDAYTVIIIAKYLAQDGHVKTKTKEKLANAEDHKMCSRDSDYDDDYQEKTDSRANPKLTGRGESTEGDNAFYLFDNKR